MFTVKLNIRIWAYGVSCFAATWIVKYNYGFHSAISKCFLCSFSIEKYQKNMTKLNNLNTLTFYIVVVLYGKKSTDILYVVLFKHFSWKLCLFTLFGKNTIKLYSIIPIIFLWNVQFSLIFVTIMKFSCRLKVNISFVRQQFSNIFIHMGLTPYQKLLVKWRGSAKITRDYVLIIKIHNVTCPCHLKDVNSDVKTNTWLYTVYNMFFFILRTSIVLYETTTSSGC